MPTNPAIAEFMLKAIAYRGDDCLLWPFGKTGMGYGTIMVDRYRQRAVHRVVCQIVHGDPIPPCDNALHNCGVPLCVNPQHLRWGSDKENTADRIRHGTMYRVRRNEKLTPDDVRAIRAMAQQMVKPLSGKITPHPADIARQFGVSRPTIYNIIDRKTWAWVD